MINRAITTIVLAGIAPAALAQSPGIRITADRAQASVGDDINWSVSVTDIEVAIGLTGFVQVYDLDFIASDATLADATPFADALSPLVAPTPGTASGADILGASGGQATLLGVHVRGNDVTIGSFTTTARRNGQLGYTITDGGTLGTNTLRLSWIAPYFGPPPWNAPPGSFHSDTVTIIPAPTPIAALAPAALALITRRRR